MIRNLRNVASSIAKLKCNRIKLHDRTFLVNRVCTIQPHRSKKDDSTLSSLFKPVPVKPTQDDINVGAELTGTALDKAELLKVLNKFSQRREIRLLCTENGLDREWQPES